MCIQYKGKYIHCLHILLLFFLQNSCPSRHLYVLRLLCVILAASSRCLQLCAEPQSMAWRCATMSVRAMICGDPARAHSHQPSPHFRGAHHRNRRETCSRPLYNRAPQIHFVGRGEWHVDGLVARSLRVPWRADLYADSAQVYELLVESCRVSVAVYISVYTTLYRVTRRQALLLSLLF